MCFSSAYPRKVYLLYYLTKDWLEPAASSHE